MISQLHFHDIQKFDYRRELLIGRGRGRGPMGRVFLIINCGEFSKESKE